MKKELNVFTSYTLIATGNKEVVIEYNKIIYIKPITKTNNL
jgi:hypothetical protein